MTTSARVRVGITTGCPQGVGPELVAKTLATAPLDVDYIWFGPAELLRTGAAVAGVPIAAHGDTEVVVGGRSVRIEAPVLSAADALTIQARSLLHALEQARAGTIDALLTSPIRKAALDGVPGGPWPGQTELCGAMLGRDQTKPLMCFAGGPFVLGLATVHLPLRSVADAITQTGIRAAIALLCETAARLRSPTTARPLRVVVLGVNPHAGEAGRLGTEESRILVPAIAAFNVPGVDIVGPIAADGFFARYARQNPPDDVDAVLAMAHDQGLGPYKLLAGGGGVNLTAGLHLPRTSPDHGTADDIAGRGIADPKSMTAALALAIRWAQSA